jgi:hypothetical protein
MNWIDNYNIMIKFKLSLSGLLKRKDLTNTERNAIGMGIELFKKEIGILNAENIIYKRRNK